jgi:hypothetical protein
MGTAASAGAWGSLQGRLTPDGGCPSKVVSYTFSASKHAWIDAKIGEIPRLSLRAAIFTKASQPYVADRRDHIRTAFQREVSFGE